MSTKTSRPALRWLVPAIAVTTVIGGGAAVGTLAANADPALPERSAAQLLVDLQTARLDGLSGTVRQQSDLGLPAITGLAAGAGQGGSSELTALLSGSHTLKVWYAGPDKARVAVMGTLGETDVIRNGTDVWMWNSRENAATHAKLSGDDAKDLPSGLPSSLPSTPQQAADAALAAIDPSTTVTTGRTASVAGRDAYELILRPRDATSLVGQIRLAIDAKEHVPLRVEVFAKDVQEPAIKVAFTQVDFNRPDAEQFVFNPPPGAKVTEHTADRPDTKAQAKPEPATKQARPTDNNRPTIVGTGWASVLVQNMGPGADVTAVDKNADADAKQVGALLEQLPKVSGSWGSGRQFTSKLFTALLTTDGRLLVGAVAPQRLYEVAATSAGR